MSTATANSPPASWEKPVPGLDVADQTPKSLTAPARLRQICDTQPAGRDEINVDQLQRPRPARNDQLVATRTLARTPPKPTTQEHGDPDTERVLIWPQPQLIPAADPAQPR